ncbi:MAG: ABC transporter ATP-binding protein [Bacteroidales bacterium]|nr:ABC transporter ATP-binding protein [Bacteroidales bacterium]MCF8457924.1 ABC transporter ATP-binding protein [Bacteroidales bacterium]
MLIKTRNLTKIYPHNDGAVHAINNLSFDIPKGSFVTVTGASGSGKTTLLLILGGLLHPSSGTMVYNGKALNMQKDDVMANFRSNHVGFVMQSFALISYLTAVENIMIALNVRNKNKAEARKQAIELLDWVGLNDRINHYPKELSAGQQQRVAIARALANSPDLLLADEPTGNLDPGLSEEILGILKVINENHNTTVIMVTHSPIAASFGNITISLENGQIKTNNQSKYEEIFQLTH